MNFLQDVGKLVHFVQLFKNVASNKLQLVLLQFLCQSFGLIVSNWPQFCALETRLSNFNLLADRISDLESLAAEAMDARLRARTAQLDMDAMRKYYEQTLDALSQRVIALEARGMGGEWDQKIASLGSKVDEVQGMQLNFFSNFSTIRERI